MVLLKFLNRKEFLFKPECSVQLKCYADELSTACGYQVEIIAHNFSMTQSLQLKLSCPVPYVYGTHHASHINLEFFL